MPLLGLPPFQHLHMFTNPEDIQTLLFWGFVEVPWCRHGWLNYWPLWLKIFNYSPLPKVREWSWIFQLSDQVVDSSGNLLSSSKGHLMSKNSGMAESSLLWITRDTPLSTNYSEISRVLRVLCQELRMKTKYIFALYHRSRFKYISMERVRIRQSC